MWLEVGRQQDEQREENRADHEGKSSLAWAAAGVHKGQALSASSGDKPYKVPDQAEDRKACDQEAVPGTKHQRQGACQEGGSQRDYGKGATNGLWKTR